MLRTKTSWKIVADPYATEEQWLPACADSEEATGLSSQSHVAGQSSIAPSNTVKLFVTTMTLALACFGGISCAQTIHAWNHFQNSILEFSTFTSLWSSGFFSWYNHPVALFLMIPVFLSYFLGMARNQVKTPFALVLIACYLAIAFVTYHSDAWPMSMSYARLVFGGGLIFALPMYLFGKSVSASLDRGGFKHFFSASALGCLYGFLFIYPTWFVANFELTLLTCFLVPFSAAAMTTALHRVDSFKTASALGLTAVVPFLIGLVVYAVIGLVMMAENQFSGYENVFLNYTRLMGPASVILLLGPLGGAFGTLMYRSSRKGKTDREELSVV